MQHDWKSSRHGLNRPRRSRGRRVSFLLVLLTAAVGTFLLVLNRPPVTETEAHVAPPPEESGISEPPPLPEIRREIVEGEIQPGDTITSLLGRFFTPQEIHDLARESRQTFPLSSICAGQPYKICITEDAFDLFEYEIDRNEKLIIRRGEEGFQIVKEAIPYTVVTERVRGTIRSSLFEAVSEIQENPELAIALADIFAYDIDFIRDIREGDTFQAVVEKRFREGEPAGYGKILAAEFTNQGKSYQAFRFQDGDQPAGYYNADGKSLRTAFLRAPLDYTRISSGFTMRRFHPIAKTWRAHPAIDYAAPSGTPIRTVGDGTIIRIGQDNGNGKHIKIRHPNGYETMYLHMSRFGKGMKQGKRVTQGEVIGYVGSTGLATGPHLCFRMTKGGSPVNPNRVRTTAGPPISKERLPAYQAAIAPLVASLEGREIHQAMVEGPEAGDEVQTR